MEWMKLLVVIMIFFLGLGVLLHRLVVNKQKPSQKVIYLVKEIEALRKKQEVTQVAFKRLFSLSKKIKRQADREYLYEYLREQKNEDEDGIKVFLEKSQILKPHLKCRSKKLFDELYLIKCVGQFGLNAYQDTVLELLEKESVHIEANAVKTLSSLGEVAICLKGIELLRKKESQLSEAFLVDALVAFKGDQLQLNSEILRRLKKQPLLTESIWMSYFETIAYEEAAPTIYQRLVASQSEEIQLVALSYFTQVKYEPIQQWLLQKLTQGREAERVLSAKALVFYPEEQVASALQGSLDDESYLVREAAARSFYALLCEHQGLFSVIEQQGEEMKQLVDDLVFEEEILSTYYKQLMSKEQSN